MNDMRIYAPYADKITKIQSPKILRFYKNIIEIVCVNGIENDNFKITDKQGNRCLAGKNTVFTKREFKTLFPKLSELVFPIRRKNRVHPR